MSSITGGIFSRPKGTTGGLVFGAARSRIGKVVTIREKVDPTNPNTAAQQTQRTIFSQVLTIVRTLGAAIYQNAWNRSVGQLPGFQSLTSILMTQMNSAFDLILTLAINLGILHVPNTLTVTSSVAGDIGIGWSLELGSNGTNNDLMYALFIPRTQTDRDAGEPITFSGTVQRSVGAESVSGFTSGVVYEVYVYFLGAGTAAGLKSIANPFEITVA